MLELINNVLNYLLVIFTGTMFIYIIVGNINLKKSKILFLLIPISFLVIYLLNYSMIKTIIYCLVLFVIYKKLFNLDDVKSLIYVILFMIIYTLTQSLVYLTNIFNEYNLLFNIINSVLILVLSYLCREKLVKIRNINFDYRLVFYIVLIFLCIRFLFYVTLNNLVGNISFMSIMIVILVMFSIIIILLMQEYRNNDLIIKYDKLLEFIKKYEIEIEKQRIMRHEIKNQLLTIKSKIIDLEDNRDIVNYINLIIDDNNKDINQVEYAKLNYLPSNGIKGLFYFKIEEAISKGIDVEINISKNIGKSIVNNLEPYMFNQVGKLFGILLDNAIEAAEISLDKKIGIEFYVIDDSVNFIISNTYKEIDKHGFFLKSIKGEGRGYGLLLAKSIVDNNKNRFKMSTEITDLLYIQKLVIK